MLRDAGAVLVGSVNNKPDFLIVGDSPLPLAPTLPADTLDPEAIARNVAARRKFDTWHQRAGQLVTQAQGLGVVHVSVGRWFIDQTYHDVDAIEVHVRLRLAGTIPVNFQRTRLEDAFDYLSHVAGLRIVVDWQVFDHAGVQPDLPVTLQHECVPAGVALRMVLEATEVHDLSFARDKDGTVHVSRAEQQRDLIPIPEAVIAR